MMTATNDAAMTRRGVLASAGAGAGAAALGGAPAAAQTGAPKIFVLVHGAWHGGWCWRRVADLLQKGGHKVFTPTLTGVGERSHLMSKDIVLDTHITDIVNVIKWEDLNNICLVVHSYGGWPGSGAIEQALDRISSIVWLDAFKPENGQRGFDFASDFSRKALLTAVEKGEPGRPAPKAEAFHVNEKDRAWVDSKLTAQPNGVALQPIRLTGAREKVAKKTYIRAPMYSQAGLRPGARRVQGRQVVAHLRDDRCRPRRDGRRARLAGGGFGRSVLSQSAPAYAACSTSLPLLAWRGGAATTGVARALPLLRRVEEQIDDRFEILGAAAHADNMAFTNPLALPKSSLPA
jgi:hypothetical protein